MIDAGGVQGTRWLFSALRLHTCVSGRFSKGCAAKYVLATNGGAQFLRECSSDPHRKL